MTNVFEHDFDANLEKHEEKKTIDDILKEVSKYIKKKDNKTIFGPYPNAYAARRIVRLINRLYPLKKCENTPKNVCLYYHIGECLGFCSKKIDKTQVEKMETEILSFLRKNKTTYNERSESHKCS